MRRDERMICVLAPSALVVSAALVARVADLSSAARSRCTVEVPESSGLLETE